MSINHDDEIQAALEELRREYLAELPGLLDALASAVTTAKKNGTPDELRTAISKAHALKGTSGSYRFTEISEAAGLMEDGLLGIQAGWLPADQGWPEIERSLAVAFEALGKAV
ncbi:MAG TPA: Hpt domain-containing protein [Polyangium sp.]|nr:Hpt domain-containing protein [Polyangium sp.]